MNFSGHCVSTSHADQIWLFRGHASHQTRISSLAELVGVVGKTIELGQHQPFTF